MTMLSYFLDKLLRKSSTVVNCWFCNKDTVVPSGNKNCFDCPSCDQYNGFTRDGSYNKVIPAQRNELLNHPIAAANQTTCASMYSSKEDNSLCQKCNSAQDAKVKKLASFLPSKPSRYDVEIEQYRQQLEKMYPLCSRCEDVVKKVLLQQKYSLLGLKNKLSGNKVSFMPSRRGLQPLRFMPVVLAAWLLFVNVFRISGSGDEEPFLQWPFERMLHVVPQALLWMLARSEFMMSVSAVIVQILRLSHDDAMSLERVGCLLLLVELHMLCWLRAWHWVLQYHMIQVITCVGILAVYCVKPLQRRRKKYFFFGLTSNRVRNVQWHRLKSVASVIRNEKKTDHQTTPPREAEQRKQHSESEPVLSRTDINGFLKNTSVTPYDDLRTAMNNLKLGFTSTGSLENKPRTIFRTKEYGGNIDRHLFRGVNLQTWNQLKDSKFTSYNNEQDCKSARSSPTLRQRLSSGVRQPSGKWSRWRDSYEPLSFVEKPYTSHSRSPSRSSGYGSLASQSSVADSVPRIVDYTGRGVSTPRWDCIGGLSTPESISSTMDLAGRQISTQNVYLGPPYVYCVFPHVLYPAPPTISVAPVWNVPTYPQHMGRVASLSDNSFSVDTGGGYLHYCEIAAYVGALLFLVYSVFCCEQRLLLGGR